MKLALYQFSPIYGDCKANAETIFNISDSTDADIIVFVSRSNDDGLSDINVVKHRHNKPGSCALQLRGEYSRFDSVSIGKTQSQRDGYNF